MSKAPQPTPEELILAMLRDVLARQAEQMGLAPQKDETAQAEPLLVPKPEVTPVPPLNYIAPKTEYVAGPLPPAPEIATPVPPPSVTPKHEVRLEEPAITSTEPEGAKAEVPAARLLFAPLSKIEAAPPPVAPKPEPRLDTPAFTPVLRNEPPPAKPEKTAPIAPPSVEDTQPTARVTRAGQPADEDAKPLSYQEQYLKKEFDELAARPFSASALPQILRVFVITLFALVTFLNVPLVQGTAIIRTLTDPQPVALSNGLLIREESGSAVYLIENGRRRLISSSEAFQHYGYRWGDVREVPRDFLRSIPEGSAIHVLVKCADLPEIYLLEGLEKRWVRDVGALEALGYDVNRDLRWVSCARLRSLFDGLPIP